MPRTTANGNNEWPVVAGVKIPTAARKPWAKYPKADAMPVGKPAETIVEARIYDRAGFR